jgi:hypothetical protein
MQTSVKVKGLLGGPRCVACRFTSTRFAVPLYLRTGRVRLYAAVGNKEQLFRKALECYQTGPQSLLGEALTKPTARAVVEAIFSGFVRMLRGRDKVRGCLMVCGALPGGRRRSRCAGSWPD